jgi:hypothetical protein
MEDGVRCELVKLHTINKEKPTKKLMGRKRKSAEEEGKEHFPVTARGLRDPLGAGDLNGAFSTSFCAMAEDTQLVTEVVFPLAMVFLVARCFTRIYQSAPGGYAQEKKEADIDNGDGGGEEELVNSTNPPTPLYTFSVEERGLRRGERSGSGSPLTGRKMKNNCATHETVRKLRVTYSKNWPMMSQQMYILDKY